MPDHNQKKPISGVETLCNRNRKDGMYCTGSPKRFVPNLSFELISFRRITRRTDKTAPISVSYVPSTLFALRLPFPSMYQVSI